MLNAKAAVMMMAAMAATMSAPAMAQGTEPLQVQVNISDLDISSAKGQADARRRIRSAVASVCPSWPDRDLYLQQAVRQCRFHALNDAMQQVQQRAVMAAGSNSGVLLQR